MLRTLRRRFGTAVLLAALIVAWGAGCNRPPATTPGEGPKPGEKEPGKDNKKKPKPPESERG